MRVRRHSRAQGDVEEERQGVRVEQPTLREPRSQVHN